MPPHPKPAFEFKVALETERAALRHHKESDRGIASRSSHHLLVATWRLASLGIQERTGDDLKLIAEILGWFDAIAIQGVESGSAALKPLMKLLPGYDFLYSESPGQSGGLTIVYDSSALQFTGETGTVDVPSSRRAALKLPGSGGRFEGFPRPPQFATFDRGDLSITLANAHLTFKSDEDRQSELEALALAQWAGRRASGPEGTAVLALGRLNLKNSTSPESLRAMEAEGLLVPDRLPGLLPGQLDTGAFLPGIAGEKLLASGLFDFDEVVFAELREQVDARHFLTYVRYHLTDSRPAWYQLDFPQSTAGAHDYVPWTGDEPARHDALHRRPVARELARQLAFVRDDTDTSSFLAHIDGPWGAGKSTLLGFLREELADQKQPWLVIDFDAWRNSQVGPAWWALLYALRRRVSRSVPPERRVSLWAAERYRLLTPSASGVVTLVLGLGGLVAAAGLASSLGAFWTALIAVASGAATIWPFGRGVVRLLSWGSPRGAKVFEDVRANPMGDLASHFEWLLRRAPCAVVFLVDDLDRCDQAYVVDLLNAIQTLMRAVPESGAAPRNKLFFVVAADGRWVRTSYEVSHECFVEVVREPGRPLGYLFLDKLFQLTITVPQLNSELQSGFLATLLRSDSPPPAGNGEPAAEAPASELTARVLASDTEDEVVAALGSASLVERAQLAPLAVERLARPGVATQTEHVLQGYAHLLDPNPRSMKRFLLAYSISRAVRTVEGSAVARDPLARWTILSIRWPELAERLRRDPEAILSDNRERLAEDLIRLLEEPTVQQLVNSLTPDGIRAATGPGAQAAGDGSA